MKQFATVVLLGLLAFGLTIPGNAWDGLDHQILWPASMILAANDGGKDFDAARDFLEQYAGLMDEAVVAPDNQPKLGKPSLYHGLLCPPLWPPVFHGHEAMVHVGFSGLEGDDSQVLIEPYFKMACEKWGDGDIPGALYDLGCGMHLVQDTSFCGHSNFLHVSSWEMHSSFENWVCDQTAPGQKPKSFDELHEEAWVVKTGGAYLKEPWHDGQGKEHWRGGLETWVDVAAHLSYDFLQSSSIKDHNNPDFRGAAHQQFVIAQRCGAGLLVDFFRRVGVIEEPWIYYLRNGEVWRVRLGGDKPEHLGPQDRLSPTDFWPTTSPDGKARLFFNESRTKEAGQSDFGVTVSDHSWGWDFSRTRWPSAPMEISRAFFLNNYFIALVDASESDNWKHLYLVHAVPGPDVWYDCPKEGMQYFFESPRGLRDHHIQTVYLPQ